jgi:hypothetical protein
MRSKVRAYSHQGHGPRADRQAGYISATSDSTPHLRRAAGSLIATPPSTPLFILILLPPGHGSLRGQRGCRNIWSGPEDRHCKVHNGLTLITCPPARRAITCTLALGRCLLSICRILMSYAATTGAVQRNGSPDRQTLCRITDSLRAKAIRALPEPERRSIASAQSFRCSDRFTR